MSGVRQESLAIWLAAVTALVNFLFTLVGVWLVEKMGRRLLSLLSMAGGLILHWYYGSLTIVFENELLSVWEKEAVLNFLFACL